MKLRGHSYFGILVLLVFILVSSSFVLSADSKFILSADSTELNVCPNSVANQAIYIKNTDSSPQVFKVWQKGEASRFAALKQTEYVLAPGETAIVEDLIEVNSFNYGKYKLYTEVTSHTGEVKLLDQTLNLNRCNNIGFSVLRDSYSNCPCSTSIFHLYVTNDGSYIDEFEVSLDISKKYYTLSQERLILAPGETADVYAYITMSCDVTGWTYPKAIVNSINGETIEEKQLYLYLDNECYNHEFSISNVGQNGVPANQIIIENVVYNVLCNNNQYEIDYKVKNNGDLKSKYQLSTKFTDFNKGYDMYYNPNFEIEKNTDFNGEVKFSAVPYSNPKRSVLHLEALDDNSKKIRYADVPFIAYNCPDNYTDEKLLEDMDDKIDWKKIFIWLFIILVILLLLLLFFILLRKVISSDDDEDNEKVVEKNVDAKEKKQEFIEASQKTKDAKSSKDEDKSESDSKFPWWIIIVLLVIILFGLFIWWLMPFKSSSILLYSDSNATLNGVDAEGPFSKHKLIVGDHIITKGEGNSRISFFNKVNMFFKYDADINILSYENKEMKIKLNDGSVFVNYEKSSRIKSFVISSKNLIVTVKGTEFTMSDEAVVVNEGTVNAVVKNNSQEFNIESGQKLIKINDKYVLVNMTAGEKDAYEENNNIIFKENPVVEPVKNDTVVVPPKKNDTVVVPPKNNTVVEPVKNNTVIVPPKNNTTTEPSTEDTEGSNALIGIIKFLDNVFLKYLLYIIVAILFIIIIFWIIFSFNDNDENNLEDKKKKERNLLDRDSTFRTFLWILGVFLLLLIIVFWILTSLGTMQKINFVDDTNSSIEERVVLEENATTYIWKKDTIKKIDLGKLASDKDDDKLTFVATNVDNIDVKIKGDVAYLIPEDGWYGERYVNFIADDGKGARGYSPDIRLVVLDKDSFLVEYYKNFKTFFSDYMSYIVSFLVLIVIVVALLVFFMTKPTGKKRNDKKESKDDDSKDKEKESAKEVKELAKEEAVSSQETNKEVVKKESVKKKSKKKVSKR